MNQILGNTLGLCLYGPRKETCYVGIINYYIFAHSVHSEIKGNEIADQQAKERARQEQLNADVNQPTVK